MSIIDKNIELYIIFILYLHKGVIKMGIIDSIKSLKPKNYRTYTLYDFSTLVKFKIFVFELDGKHVDTLPAQINPPSINYKKRKTVAEKIVLRDKGGTREDISENTISIEFDFNIVDEYEARTAGGKLPIDLNIDEITTSSPALRFGTVENVLTACEELAVKPWAVGSIFFLVFPEDAYILSFLAHRNVVHELSNFIGGGTIVTFQEVIYDCIFVAVHII